MVERELKLDLDEVNRIVHNQLLPWWSDIRVYVDKAKQESTWDQLPGAVLAVYRYLGHPVEYSIKMAAIFKMTYLASFIHELVGDDEEGQVYDRNMQFAILIGDYIFGCILKMLVEIGADPLLDVFSNTIAQVNEGMVMKHKLHANPEKVIAMTRASLYRAAFLSAARSAGLAAEVIVGYSRLGYHIGMALEIQASQGFISETVKKHCKKSLELFHFINQGAVLSGTSLELLIRDKLDGPLARAAI